MEPGQGSSDVRNVVSGRVDGSVTMAHTIGEVVHGVPWSRVAVIVLAVLTLAVAVVVLAACAVYRVSGAGPQTTVVSIMPAPPAAAPPAVTATPPPATTATSAVPAAVARVGLPAVTTNRPTTNVPVTTTATAAPTTTAPTTTSRPDVPTTTTSAAADQCNYNGTWLACRP